MSSKITTGTRAQVWHGTARHTSGGLTKSDLMKNKAGRIVSRKKHHSAKKDNRLVKAGYKTKKGTFGFVKVGSRKRGRKSHKGGSSMDPATRALMAGGAPYGDNVSPSNFSVGNNNASSSSTLGNRISGAGITNFGSGSTNVHMRAGMTAGSRRKKMRGGRTPGAHGAGIATMRGGRTPGAHGAGIATMRGGMIPGSHGSGEATMNGGMIPGSHGSGEATMNGGRRRKGRKLRGGTTNRSHQGLGSAGVQVKAGMYGGTTSHRTPLSPSSVDERAMAA